MNTRRLWIGFIAVLVVCFSVLGFFGNQIYRQVPPIPSVVTTHDGSVLFTSQDIKDGQNVWQSMGGQEVGTVWGHGAYVAPDWSADWLHRESEFILGELAKSVFNSDYASLDAEKQAVLKVKLQREMRTNTYDPNADVLKLSDLRVQAYKNNVKYYSGLFMNDPALSGTRTAYAIPPNTIKTQDRMNKMCAFYFWAAWACITKRPGQDITYTNNWPPDEMIGNKPGSCFNAMDRLQRYDAFSRYRFAGLLSCFSKE